MSSPSDRPAERPRGLPIVGRLTDVAGSIAGSLAETVAREADLDAVLDEIDADHLLDQVDPNRLLDRVDPDRLLDRVDVNRLLDRVDVNRLLDRVEPERLLDRVDVERLVHRAGIAEIVADSTGQVAGSALDTVRRQVVGLDVILMRVLFRLTGRDLAALPAGPGIGVPAVSEPAGGSAGGVAAAQQGRYAGLLSRALAFLVDLALATAVFTGVLALGAGVLERVVGVDASVSATSRPLFLVLLLLWYLLYWGGTLTLQGRTAAMSLLGLRVVRDDGTPLGPGRVLSWVLVLPISALVFGGGFLLMLLGEHRRTLHDRVAGAAMIVDWSGAPAAPLDRWISAHEEPS